MKKQLIIIGLLTALTSSLHGATDGVLGPTSQGSVNLSFTVTAPPTAEIQISGLDDFDWGNVEVYTDLLPITKDVCVYLPLGGTYTITIEPVNYGFLGLLDRVDYSVIYTDGVTELFMDSSTFTSETASGFSGSSSAGCMTDSTFSQLTIDPQVAFSQIADPSGSTIAENDVFTEQLILTVTPD